MQHGCFVIRNKNMITSQMTDVLSLSIPKEHIENATFDAEYDLEKLQDFESRLALIAGQLMQDSEKTGEVQTFLHVSFQLFS